ncbi:MAG: hypothetical protein ACO34E_18500, partial [Limisphaerales bacterium]
FLVPAMGSHGGATAEGQLGLLADYGVTEASMGVAMDGRMETEVLGVTADGVEVHAARSVVEADAVLILNRVKPHTDFGGAIGSGLLKMLVVGVGKHAGALAFHRAAQRLGYEPALRTMSEVAFGFWGKRLLGGLAVIEDARHRLARLEVVRGEALSRAEERLAAEAARHMPRLPLEDIDLLIVDRIGKNISGTGMDPNVIGRMIHGYSLIESELPQHPRIRRIFVRGLSAESHGNAIGIGMADFTTRELEAAMKRDVTYLNSLTALSLQGAKLPIVMESDRMAVAAALSSLGLADTRTARVVRIQDTLSLEEMWVSEPCLEELRSREGVEVAGAMELAHHLHLTDAPLLQRSKEGDRALEIELLSLGQVHRDGGGAGGDGVLTRACGARGEGGESRVPRCCSEAQRLCRVRGLARRGYRGRRGRVRRR